MNLLELIYDFDLNLLKQKFTRIHIKKVGKI